MIIMLITFIGPLDTWLYYLVWNLPVYGWEKRKTLEITITSFIPPYIWVKTVLNSTLFCCKKNIHYNAVLFNTVGVWEFVHIPHTAGTVLRRSMKIFSNLQNSNWRALFKLWYNLLLFPFNADYVREKQVSGGWLVIRSSYRYGSRTDGKASSHTDGWTWPCRRTFHQHYYTMHLRCKSCWPDYSHLCIWCKSFRGLHSSDSFAHICDTCY